MRMISITCGVLVAYLTMSPAGICSPPALEAVPSWNQQKAADYLDQRIAWWMAWPAAARDQGTFCVSCHTAVPYALARPALRAALGEKTPSNYERKLLDNVAKRVHLWNEIEPFYANAKDGDTTAARARGTEAVLNALILASHDARSGKLSDTTRIAFENMWSLQRTDANLSGSWWWLQFDNEPFEAPDSNYYGAALAAVAVGVAPEQYRSSPQIQKHLRLLHEYLNREFEAQSPINQVVVLWASAKWPELLTREQQQSIISDLAAKQQTDGGWNLASLSWTWRDWNLRSLVKMYARSYGTPLEGKGDAYATGLIAFTLEQLGRRDDGMLKRAIAWLERNQNQTEGSWQSYSLNGQVNPASSTGHFMTDAATAYAVLALTTSNRF